MSKNKRKTVAEKLVILKEAKTKGAVETVRKYNITYPTYLDWKNKFENGGEKSLSGQSDISYADLKKLQIENSRLKEIVAEKELHIKIQNELLKKK
jgi:putative transposase